MYGRKAIPSDFKEILALDPDHKIYGGNDYLPALFAKYMQDPNTLITVCIKDGRIVALAMANLVDNGETVMGMAARTHQDVRGTGVWRAMRSINKLGSSSMENAKYFGGVVGEMWHQLKGKPEEHWGEPHLLLRQVMQIHQFDHTRVQDNTSIQTAEGISTNILSDNQSFQYLRNPEIQWRLFPNKRLVCNSGIILYKLLDENFNTIIKEKKAIVASTDSNNQCKSLSLGFGLNVHNGYQYTVHYYIDHHICDVTNLIHHILIHLAVAVKIQTKQPLQVRLVLQIQLPLADVTQAIRNIPSFEKTVVDKVPFYIFERERQNKYLSKL